jgi:cation transport ATPase
MNRLPRSIPIDTAAQRTVWIAQSWAGRSVNTPVVDKTGTLTEGNPMLMDVPPSASSYGCER